jgi:hypothetical protein
MNRIKTFFSVILAAVFLLAQVGAVSAAPATQEGTPTEEATTISGTVQSITTENDPATGETIVKVTLLDEATGATQTVPLSLDTAVALGLVTLDEESGNPVVNEEQVGQPLEIDPSTVLTGGEETDDSGQHPVGSALADFFSGLVGVDYDTVMSYHDEGMGFGTLAQALWMTKSLGGDSSMFSAILDAKRSGDYSAVTLPDGSTPTNWGQFKKAVRENGMSAKDNLGEVMSNHGKAPSDDESTLSSESELTGPGKSNGKGQDNPSNDKSNKDKNKNKGNGKNK